mgnify:CR=1 FL=1
MNKETDALETLKKFALSDLDSIPKTAVHICEKYNEETMKNYETLKQIWSCEKKWRMFCSPLVGEDDVWNG